MTVYNAEFDVAVQAEIERFFSRVSAACDAQDWDAYLGFFTEDSEFHIPQWISEHEHTSNPKREMSLMYYPNRSGLEDRIFRIRTGKSAACTPMPRTLHVVNGVLYEEAEAGYKVQTNWITHYYRFGETKVFYGRANYMLVREGNDLKISYKQAILLNDKIESVLDFYHV